MASVFVGVDVGGTFTDAVAVRGGEVVASAKILTEPERLERSLLGALETVLAGISPADVARLSLSTTLITNLLAQKRVPPVALLLVPGPGVDPASYALPGRVWTAGGAMDFRGREIAPLGLADVVAALEEIHAEGYRHLAVVGKFSPRNPAHEVAIVRRAEVHGDWEILAGHAVTGQLNFPRRAAAAALTLAVAEPYRAFYAQIRESLAGRGLTCPIVVLKADGGTLPLEAAAHAPLESVFSGPAASAMGAVALLPPEGTAVVVDVGGTTTDLALVLEGAPLFASRGAEVAGYTLPTRAFAVRSVPVGGDSTVALESGAPVLRPTRAGVAACLGGPAPTLTDALCLLGHASVGDPGRAREALAALGDPEVVAAAVVEQAIGRISGAVDEIFARWQREPVYRLWELRRRDARRPATLVGIGAAAPALVPALAERLGADPLIPPHASVANALGAAVARTTYTTTLHVDTEQRILEVVEAGFTDSLPPGRYTLDAVRELAREWMARQGRALGVAEPLEDVVEVLAEQFNVVEGWRTVGKIFDVRLERACGVVATWERGGQT